MIKRIVLALLGIIALCTSLSAAGSTSVGPDDTDGSLDLDLSLALSMPAKSLAGTPLTVGLAVTNEATSQGTGYDLGVVITLPADAVFHSSSLGEALSQTATSDGGTRITLESADVVVVGETWNGTVNFTPGSSWSPGTTLGVSAVAYADDSPFERGAPPSDQTEAFWGGVDLTSPSSAAAQTAAADDDDGAASFPAEPVVIPSTLSSEAQCSMSLFQVSVQAGVSEGERATGTGSNSYLTTVRLTGNAVATVSNVHLTDVISSHREFLGFTSIPSGATVQISPNVPGLGQVTLDVTSLTIPAGGQATLVYRSGITEYRVTDAVNVHTAPNNPLAPPLALEAGPLIMDGGTPWGGGDKATDHVHVISAVYQNAAVMDALLPADAQVGVEAEFMAVTKSVAGGTHGIGDTVTYTLSYTVSQYVDLVAPTFLADTLPDGMVFAGPASVQSSGPLAFDSSSGTPDPATGDTLVRFGLPSGLRLTAGASGTVTFEATIDGVMDGSGESWFDVADVIVNSVVGTATVADEGSTDSALIGQEFGDQSQASFLPPQPTLSTTLVTVTHADGTFYDGTGNTPVFDPAQHALQPGTQMRLGVVVEFPNAVTVGVGLDDFLPLLGGPNTVVQDILLNTNGALVDISGQAIPANDGDGDGSGDSQFAGHSSPWNPSAGSFLTTSGNNGFEFVLGNAPPNAVLSLLIDVSVTDDVPSPIPTNGLLPVRNATVLQWANETAQLAGSLHDDFDMIVGCPVVSLSRLVLAGNNEPDIGDVIRHELRLVNSGASDAFLDSFKDKLPSGVTFDPASLTITDGEGNSIAAPTAYTLNGKVVEFFFRPSAGLHESQLPSNSAAGANTVIVTYDTVVANTAVPGSSLKSTATASYFTSANAPESEDFGPLSATSSTKLDKVSMSQLIHGSDQPHTKDPWLAIGEVVTLRITALLPEYHLSSVRIVDSFVEGLELLSASVVSIESPITTNGGTNQPLISLLDSSGDGVLDQLSVDLGDVINPASSVTDIKSIVIDVQARVRDLPANTNGKSLSGKAQFKINTTKNIATSKRNVRVALPLLDLTKWSTADYIDAGDTVVYTVRLGHASGSKAGAFNIVVTDTLPSQLTPLSVGNLSQSSHQIETPVLTGTGSASNPVRMSVGDFPKNSWIQFDITCRLDQELLPKTWIENKVNGTGYTLPGGSEHAGTASDEGDDAVETHNVLMAPSIGGTSSLSTTGSQLTVGETATLTLLTTIPEGSVPELVVRAILPNGLSFVEEASPTFSPGVSAENIPPVDTSIPGQISWDFGKVTNADRIDSVTEKIACRATVVVDNVPSNQHNTKLHIDARADYLGGSSGIMGTDVAVALPALMVNSQVSEAYAMAGDVITLNYRVFQTAPGGLLAYEPKLVAYLPDVLEWQGGLTSQSGPTPTCSASADGTVLSFALEDVLPEQLWNNPVAFSVDLRLGAEFAGELAIVNSQLEWSTLDGTPALALVGVESSGERTGNPADNGADVNDLWNAHETQFDDFSNFIIGFEDLAGLSLHNDFDYNDLLVAVDSDEVYNPLNQLTALTVRLTAMARGAAFDHKLWLRLGVAGPVAVEVTRRDEQGAVLSAESISSAGAYIDDIVVFPSSISALPQYGDGLYPFAANTAPDQDFSVQTPGHVTEIEVTVLDPTLNAVVVDDASTRGLNEHLHSMYGFKLDVLTTGSEVIARGVKRNSTQSLVTAQNFPGSPLLGYPLEQSEIFSRTSKWPTERTRVWQGFPGYISRIQSGGSDDANWHQDPDVLWTWPAPFAASSASVPDDDDELAALVLQAAEALAGTTTERIPVFGKTGLQLLMSTGKNVANSQIGGSKGLLAGGRRAGLGRGKLGKGGPISGPTPGLGGGVGGGGAEPTQPQQVSVTAIGGPLPATPLLQDVDGDGAIDLVLGGFLGGVTVADPRTGAVRWQFEYDAGLASQASVTAIDQNNDGVFELIRGHEDGSLWSALPDGSGRTKLLQTHGPIKGTAAYGDVTGDGVPELVVLSGDATLHVLNGTEEAPGYPVGVGYVHDTGDHTFFTGTPALAQLDDQPGLEIIVGTLDGQLIAWTGEGHWLSGWPRDVSAPVVASPAVGPLVAGGDPVIVALDVNGRLTVLETHGDVLPGWPVDVPFGGGPTSPVIADLDGDGQAEIIVGSLSGAVHVYDATGSPVPGWPQGTGSQIMASPAVGDLDGNPGIELAIGGFDGRLSIFGSDGSAVDLPGAEPQTLFESGGLIVGSVVLADINGDGLVELAVTSYAGTCTVLRTNGKATSGSSWNRFRGSLRRDGYLPPD